MTLQIGQQVALDFFHLTPAHATIIALDPGVITLRLDNAAGSREVTVSPDRLRAALSAP